MTTDLTIRLVNQPGTLARAADALGHAGVNIDGACGFVCAGDGIFHVLVSDAEQARRALIDAGFELQAERTVVTAHVENRPGEGARILRRIADAGANIELLYMTVDGRLVLAGDDLAAIHRAID